MHNLFKFALILTCTATALGTGAHAQTPDQRSESECKKFWLEDSKPANWDRYYECIGNATAKVPEADPGGGGIIMNDDPLGRPPSTARVPPDELHGGAL